MKFIHYCLSQVQYHKRVQQTHGLLSSCSSDPIQIRNAVYRARGQHRTEKQGGQSLASAELHHARKQVEFEAEWRRPSGIDGGVGYRQGGRLLPPRPGVESLTPWCQYNRQHMTGD